MGSVGDVKTFQDLLDFKRSLGSRRISRLEYPRSPQDAPCFSCAFRLPAPRSHLTCCPHATVQTSSRLPQVGHGGEAETTKHAKRTAHRKAKELIQKEI